MMKDFSTIQAELAQPFAPQDLEWRVQFALQDRMQGLVVPYVTCRAIQDRLDAVVGADNWCNVYQRWNGNDKKDAQICGESRKEWITKWDGAENTDIESVKGGLSDAMKRAAVQWGIGRVLYKLPNFWAGVQPRGKSYFIPDTERPKLDKAYMEALGRMNLVPAAPGGLQSQLTGMSGPGIEQPDMTRTGGNPAGRNNVGQGVQPGGGNAATTFTVMSYKFQKGINHQTTILQLRDNSSGELIQVYFNGVDQRLVPNTVLANARITQRTQDAVIYLVLERYDVQPLNAKAA